MSATFWKGRQKLSPAQIDEASQQYVDGRAVTVIAHTFGVCDATLYYHLRRRGLVKHLPPIEERKCGVCDKMFFPINEYREQKYCSAKCRNVGAGQKITKAKIKGPTVQGAYRTVRVPDGHVSRTTTKRKRNGRAPEHIVIAESALGRALQRGEVVHHINCNPLDNRPGNLMVCSRSYHAWLHGEMSRRWARENVA